MTIDQKAEEFLTHKRVAVVGVSHQTSTANALFDRMRSRGYEVIPVNPTMDEFEGQPCYPSVKAIPNGVKAVLIVTRPDVTSAVVRDCAEAGVSHVWMHNNPFFGKGNSSASDEAVTYCEEHGMTVIPVGCPMMYGKTGDFGHRCMHWLLEKTGKLSSLS